MPIADTLRIDNYLEDGGFFATMADDVRQGLTATPKKLLPKYLWRLCHRFSVLCGPYRSFKTVPDKDPRTTSGSRSVAALARWCVTHRLLVILLWLAALGGAASAAALTGSAYSNDYEVPGTAAYEYVAGRPRSEQLVPQGVS